jgi:hypothetical protein
MAKMNTNLDDWETDPDFVREMDEMDQRWGNKRTVGSINMNELIDEVRRDHKTIREKNRHSSQRDYSTEFEAPPSTGFETQKKISRKVVTESRESSYVKDSVSNRNQTRQESTAGRKSNPVISPKPDVVDLKSRLASAERSSPSRPKSPQGSAHVEVKTDPPRQFKESVTKRVSEEKSSFSSSRDDAPPSRSPSAAFKSIQNKIDAFKKDFEDIESRVAKKSDISRLIKKSTNVEEFNDDLKYVTRSTGKLEQTNRNQQRATSATSPNGSNRPDVRPSSTSPLYGNRRESPKTSIKSLSEKFESLGRETSEDFRRRMEERRREFFDEIKTQVRETRKGLDGFDVMESDEEDVRAGTQPRSHNDGVLRSVPFTKPKVYTKRETSQEQVVSTLVKENDRVIHDETKRNVERTSSCHGSSDDDQEATRAEPTSIKHISRELKSARQPAGSPLEELKRKMPHAEPASQSAGLMARTLYDYQAAEPDELSFDVDELITNIEKLDEGWYKGTISRGDRKQVGLFPANYVKLLNDSGFY